MEKYISKIEKEFDKQLTAGGKGKYWSLSNGDVRTVKSFLKQSFIKYLQSEVERLEGEMFVEPSQAGQFAMHSGGYNQALEEQITHITNQIKELESIKN